MVCNLSSRRIVWSTYVSKTFDFQSPEYLITLSGTPFTNWSDTLPLRKEWVEKRLGFNPIEGHVVFNTLRNSLYVIFGISCSSSDPFKDLNMTGTFVRLLRDSSGTFDRMVLTRFWRWVYILTFWLMRPKKYPIDQICNDLFWCLPEKHVQSRV